MDGMRSRRFKHRLRACDHAPGEILARVGEYPRPPVQDISPVTASDVRRGSGDAEGEGLWTEGDGSDIWPRDQGSDVRIVTVGGPVDADLQAGEAAGDQDLQGLSGVNWGQRPISSGLGR